jgi:hypothetical protein
MATIGAPMTMAAGEPGLGAQRDRARCAPALM